MDPIPTYTSALYSRLTEPNAYTAGPLPLLLGNANATLPKPSSYTFPPANISVPPTHLLTQVMATASFPLFRPQSSPILMLLLISHLISHPPKNVHLTPDFHCYDPGLNCHCLSPRLSLTSLLTGLPRAAPWSLKIWTLYSCHKPPLCSKPCRASHLSEKSPPRLPSPHASALALCLQEHAKHMSTPHSCCLGGSLGLEKLLGKPTQLTPHLHLVSSWMSPSQ